MGYTVALFRQWLAADYHGQVEWLHTNLSLRANPALLVANTVRVISVAAPYMHNLIDCHHTLADRQRAYIVAMP